MSRYSHSSLRPIPVSGERPLLEGLGSSLVDGLEKPLASSTGDKVVIVNLKYLGSYNWTEARSPPEIIVPGSPRIWNTSITPPYSLFAPDTGKVVFVDQNGFRLPSAVLLPLFKAVDKIEENADAAGVKFDWSSVDFVTDRNGLRKLLRWIDGKTPVKEFRIDMQLAGKKTVLFSRWEKKTREIVNQRSYGFGFEKASTTSAPGCERSTGHHRIVTYDMNGLKMVVRFEVDACLPVARAPVVAHAKQTPTTKPPPSVDDLAGLLSRVSVGSASSTSEAQDDPAPLLKVTEGGAIVPQSNIIEMTTRASHRAHEYDWNESYPQLFLSQTPLHYLATHNRGRFEAVQKRKLDSAELQSVADAGQRSLQHLCLALKDIKKRVITAGERGRLTLICRDGKIAIYQRESDESCVPDDVMERFEI